MAEFLADKCDDLGFEDIQIDEVGNIIARKGSGSPRIMLCGHMDVVPGKVKVRKEGDSLYGRGASDEKLHKWQYCLPQHQFKTTMGQYFL